MSFKSGNQSAVHYTVWRWTIWFQTHPKNDVLLATLCLDSSLSARLWFLWQLIYLIYFPKNSQNPAKLWLKRGKVMV